MCPHTTVQHIGANAVYLTVQSHVASALHKALNDFTRACAGATDVFSIPCVATLNVCYTLLCSLLARRRYTRLANTDRLQMSKN